MSYEFINSKVLNGEKLNFDQLKPTHLYGNCVEENCT